VEGLELDGRVVVGKLEEGLEVEGLEVDGKLLEGRLVEGKGVGDAVIKVGSLTHAHSSAFVLVSIHT